MMYTLEEIRAAIKDSALLRQGRALFEAGAVRQTKGVGHGGYVRYFGVVRDGGEMVMAAFSYTPSIRWISGVSCECAEFKKTAQSCPHAAALMYAVMKNGEEASSNLPDGSAHAVHREAMALRREKIRQEEMRREQEMREERRGEIDALIGLSQVNRFASMQEQRAALAPVLVPMGSAMGLELRIGVKKMYTVRSLKEFAERMARRESCVYGKELTFSHRAEDVEPQDHALLWQIVAMAQGESDGSRIEMTGAQLDQTMRLLIGREVILRGEDGKTVRAAVETGGELLCLSLERKGRDYILKMELADVVCGMAGAYFIRREEGKILCLFGAAFDRIAPLLRLGLSYPQGAVLEENQLPGACANLIAPAMSEIKILCGEDIVLGSMPMALTTRFYVDIEGRNRLTCRVVHDYGAVQLAPGEENPHIRRDTAAEEAALSAARRLFPLETEAGFAFEGNDDACFELIDRKIHALSAYGEVMIVERLTRMDVKKRSAMTIGVSVSEPGLLLVKADLGGLSQEELAAAYHAYRLKKTYVRLESGAFLSGEALEQAADAAKTLESIDLTAEEAQQGAQVPAGRAMYLDAALKERKNIQLRTPKAVEEWVDRLKNAQKVSAQNPQTLKATLRDYQLEGLSWLTALSDAGFGGILADDMGLGKTMQALAQLLSCKERGENVRALVVCPASLQLNWENEAEKFAPSLRALTLMGDADERKEKILGEAQELLIVSYDQLRRDAALYKGISFSHIFLDEAQNIKNAASQTAKAVKTLVGEHRFAMTGTPIENRLSELWSIFDFLMPGYLLTYKKFKERFETPIVKDGDEKALKNLRMMTAPFILRRMKTDVLDDLPEKTEKIMTSEMTPDQLNLYRAHAAQLISKADGGFADPKDRIAVLAGLTRLRQLCCDPQLCVENYAGGSGKKEQCLELVQELLSGGHRVLLFSQFTAMLDLLKAEFDARGVKTFMLKGDTDKRERMELVKAFNNGQAQVFLISLKAGGTGLNLTGADVVIHYDPWWNTSAQNQATDRAYRIGQKRGVQVIKLIALDSIEARILKLQEHKTELSDGVLAGGENLYTMDAQALKRLLK